MKINLLILLIVLQTNMVWAQIDERKAQPFTLQEAYKELNESWPEARKAEIQKQITELNQRIVRSGWFPDVRINARMSYQSDVVDVPFSVPGTSPTKFSKDHYNVSLEITQPLFDGGRTSALQETEEYSGDAEQAMIRSGLLSVRGQLEQVWFGILMMRKQEETLELLQKDIREQLAVVQAMVKNGVLLPGDEMALKAELIGAEQERIKVRGDIRAGYTVLTGILGMKISPDISLEIPDRNSWVVRASAEINRPEYDLFEANESRLYSQKRFAAADKLPSLSFFARSSYGRPGLNMFDDDLQFNWVAGLRAQWSFKNRRITSLQTDVIDLRQRNLDADRDTFTRQLQSSLRQDEETMEAIKQQIRQDEEILELRSMVAAEKRSRLKQGVITSTEYISELNAEMRAKVNLEIRKLQLTKNIIEYETKQGFTWN